LTGTGSALWPYYGDLHTAWNGAAPDLYDMKGPADADAAMYFYGEQTWTDDANFEPDDAYENPLPTGEATQQWVIASGEAFWMKYDGPDWEDWDVDSCEVGPESACAY